MAVIHLVAGRYAEKNSVFFGLKSISPGWRRGVMLKKRCFSWILEYISRILPSRNPFYRGVFVVSGRLTACRNPGGHEKPTEAVGFSWDYAGLQLNCNFIMKTAVLYGFFRNDFAAENDISVVLYWRERIPQLLKPCIGFHDTGKSYRLLRIANYIHFNSFRAHKGVVELLLFGGDYGQIPIGSH